MQRQHCTNFPDIAQEKSRANIEQKDKFVWWFAGTGTAQQIINTAKLPVL